MKEPKTFTRPRLYWGALRNSPWYTGRLRIIYPDGRTEWSYDTLLGVKQLPCEPTWADNDCCWAIPNQPGHVQVIEMRRYDKYMVFEPAIFLGEL